MDEKTLIKNTMLEKSPCPLCAGSEVKKRRYQFSPYTVVQCSECLLWYLSPRLKEKVMLAKYSSPEYFLGTESSGYSDSNGSYLSQQIALKHTFRDFLEKIHKLDMTGGELLEVGSAYGFFLEEASGFFDELTGLDFDARAVGKINELGFTGIVGGVESIPKGKVYDLIVSINVIEHIYQPQQFICQLTDHLKKDGWVILGTPYANNFWFNLLGKKWPSFKLPEHIAFYDKRTLTELFKVCGAKNLVPLKYSTAYPIGTVFNKLGMNFSFGLSKCNIWIPSTVVTIAAQF